MRSKLVGRLREHCKQACSEAEDALAEALVKVSKRLESKLVDSMLDDTDFSDQRLVEAIATARDAAATLDACDLLERKVLARDLSHPFIEDIDVAGSTDFWRLRQLVDDHREWLHRGYVYVAWRMRAHDGLGPYYYVGRAGTGERLDLNGHSKLSHALRPATVLSIIFPTRSDFDTLRTVEASVLRVLRAVDLTPVFNEKPETVPAGIGAKQIGSKHLARLGSFLERTGALLRGSSKA